MECATRTSKAVSLWSADPADALTDRLATRHAVVGRVEPPVGLSGGAYRPPDAAQLGEASYPADEGATAEG